MMLCSTLGSCFLSEGYSNLSTSKILYSYGTVFTPKNTTFGVIVYHETMGYRYTSDSEKQTIVNRLKQIGNRIVLYTQPEGWISWDLKTDVLRFTQLAKAQRMRVVWALRDEGLPDTHWIDYRNWTFTIAQDAQAAGVDELWVGVEMGFRLDSWAQAQLVNNTLQLIVDTKQYFSGVVTTECSWWEEMDAWGRAVNDTRFPSKLFFSMYDPYDVFTSRIDLGLSYFGSKFRIGEWGTNMDLAGQEKITFGQGFQARMNYIISKNITEAYTFDYKELDNDPSQQTFGLWTLSTDQPKPSWNMLLQYSST